MELPGIQRRIPSRIYKKEELRLFLGLLFSPDLNPIERVWHIMKNYLQDNFPEVMSYDVLRGAVKEAWENVGQSEFETLIQSMPARCQAVIDANGLFTKY